MHYIHTAWYANQRKIWQTPNYTGYIESSEVSRIQVDPRSALSIIPRRVMQHLEIPIYRLSSTQTIAMASTPMVRALGKIKLKCQIGDLKSKVICYVIDADTSYNLLLGHSWIHHSSIVPSTFHQLMKYANEEREVRTLIAEKHSFKGVNSFKRQNSK